MSQDAPPIDLVHLAQYTGGDPKVEAEVLAMVAPQAQGYIKTMAASNGGEAWLVAAHSLKGMALGVGARVLAALAEAAEKSEAVAPALRASCLADLEAEVARIRAFVDGRAKD